MNDKDLECDWDTIPVLPEQLVRILQERFPLALPTPTSTERGDLYAAGQQSVIQELIDGRQYQIDRSKDALTP